MKKRQEIQFINFLQFIGPIFVILGHSLNGIPLEGFWRIFTKKWIYMFHMPLFFMIAGYLLASNNWIKEKNYKSFIKKKFYRLVVPYLVWNGIFYVPKYFLQTYLVDDVQFNIFYLIKIFIAPRQNIWGHTWFLVGIFLVYLFTPIWEKIFSKITVLKIIMCYALGVVLYVLPIQTEVLCLSDLHKDILFFGIGCILGRYSVEKLKKLAKKILIPNIFLTIVVSLICLNIITSPKLWFLPCSLILMTLLSIGLCFDGKLNDVIFKYSRRSFGIYIMHWPAMLIIRVIFYQIFKLNSYITVCLMIIAGIIVPNIIISLLNKIKLGKLNKILNYLLGV